MSNSWYFKNKKQAKEYHKKYREDNSHIFRAKDHSYRARKLKALPKWLTIEMKKKMTKIYEYCRYSELYSGIKYSVDHIVPLKGENVCGLHVPWNLQIVPSEYNIRKQNKIDFIEDIQGFIVIDKTLLKNNKKTSICRKVIRLSDGKIFHSVSEASRQAGCNNSTMTQVCKGKRISVRREFYKYLDEVIDYKKEYDKSVNSYLNSLKTNKAVYCITEGIKFFSAKEAAQHYNTTAKKIREVINKKVVFNNKLFKYCI